MKMTRSTPPPLKSIKVREEVLKGDYQPAIDLALIDKPDEKTPKFLTDPVEFFKRTAVTDGLRDLVVKVLMSLLNIRELTIGNRRYLRSSKLFVLPSLFGGGKSHALATVYHVVKVIASSRTPEEAYSKLITLDRDVAELVKTKWSELVKVKPKVIIVDGRFREYAPAPPDKQPIKTIWGYIAEKLGEYQLVSTYDTEVTPPPEDVLERVLSGKGAVVLIDELVVYCTRFGEKVEAVHSFVQMLAELLGQKEVPSVAVVLTLPYSVEKQAVESAYSKTLPGSIIARLLERTKPETIIVTAPEDLAMVIRRRVFDEDPAQLEELGKALAERIVASVPAEASRSIVDELRDELPRTYPVHPETIRTLRDVHHYLAGYVQLTRTPLFIISEAVRAVNYGCFDWMGFDPYLLMPYHIPVFDENVPIKYSASEERYATELMRLKNILRSVVFKEHTPVSENCSVKLQLADHLDNKQYVNVATAISVYIWLRTLAGLGLLDNLDVYPTKDQILYAIIDLPVANNKLWYDIDTTLLYLKNKIPFLTEHEGRWLFKWTPPLNELVKQYVDSITDKEIEEKLIDLIQGFEKEKGRLEPRVLRTAKLYFNEIKEEDGSNPSIIVFTHPVRDEEIVDQIKYTNTVVLAPNTKAEAPSDVISELKALGIEVSDKTPAWEALKLAVKHLIACQDKITEKDLEKKYKREIEHEKGYMNILRERLTELASIYSRLCILLIKEVYKEAKVKRENTFTTVSIKGGIKKEGGVIKSVEDALIEGGLLAKGFNENWIKNLVSVNLGLDPMSPSGIPMLQVWRYLLTSTTVKVSIPVLDLNMYVESALLPVKNLEYAVKAGNTLYWKRIYGSRSEAVEAFRKQDRKQEPWDALSEDDFSNLVKTVARSIREGKDVALVHYSHIVDEWIKRNTETLKHEVLVLTNGEKDYLLDTVLSYPGYKDFVRKLACYREKLTVKPEVKAPETVDHGSSFDIDVSLESEAIKRVKVKVEAEGATLEQAPPETVEVPFRTTLKLKHDSSSREIAVRVIATDEEGNVLGRCEERIKVRAPVEKVFEEKKVTVDEARELLKAQKLVAVKTVEVETTEDFYRLLRLLEELRGGITVTAHLERLRVLTDEDLTVDEAKSVVQLIADLKRTMRVNTLRIAV
ncbi:MAG: DUF499 domain-containing protein, partial [Nanopusillaceae archaeon]